MPTETIEQPASQVATAKADASDAKKSDNVNGPSVAHALLKREAALAAKKPLPTESVVQAAKAAEETAKTSVPDAAKQAASEPAKEDAVKAADSEADEALSKSKLTPELQEILDKRIGKERAKRGDAERRVAELEAKLAATIPVPIAQPPTVTPTPDNPLANVQDMPGLEKEIKTITETKLWALEQLDRDDIGEGVKVGTDVYTKPRLKEIVRNMERILAIHVPERAKYLGQRAASEKLALETFDWLKDQSSDQYKAFQKIMADQSGPLGRMPNAVYAVAAAVEGQVAVNLRRAIAENNRGTKPVEKQRAPASQIASSAGDSPIREAGSSRAVAALQADMDRMKKGHGVKVSDVTKFLAKRDQTHR
jgi:hypothetical protein